MLARAGHRMTITEDGEATLRCLMQSGLDLAFVDIRIPFVDGIELTARIRSSDDPSVANLPIVALSAGACGEDRAEEVGMNDDVTKPAPRDGIADAVDPAGKDAHRSTGTAAAVDLEPVPEVLDRRIFEQQRATFGDQRLLRFLTMLAEELGRRRVAIDESADRESRMELGQHAHAIASAAGNLGFRRLMSLGGAFERAVGSLPVEELAATLDAFRRAIDDTTTSVTALQVELERRQKDGHAAG